MMGRMAATERAVLGQVRSGRKCWADGTPVAGQPRQDRRGAGDVSTTIRSAHFEYGHDDIGNRRCARAGGDANGAGLRPANYSATSPNQYSSRDVP
jgi:hypothetical protein